MADTITKVVTVDVTGAVKSLKEMREEVESSGYTFKSLGEAKKYIDLLRASLLDLDETSDEYVDRVEEIDKVQEKLNKAMKVTGSTLKAAKGSYNDLSKRMSELKKAFKATNDEAERKVLAKQIGDINNQLKGMDASIGNFQRNVGNYEAAFTSGINSIAGKIEALGNPLAIAKKGVMALSNAFKTLIMNPVGAVIMAIVGALAALKKGFDSDEEASNSLHRALSALQPIMNAVTNLFAGFARIVGGIAEKAIPAMVNALQKAAGWMMKVLNTLGIVSDETLANFNKNIEAQKQAVKTSQELMTLEQDARKKERDLMVQRAKTERDVNELRAKAAKKDKYTAQEREKFLQEAVNKERELNKAELDLAQQQYDIVKRRSEMVVNSAKDNEELAAAEAKLYDTQSRYYEKERSLSTALQKTKKEQAAATKSAADEEKKALEELEKEREKELEQVAEIQKRVTRELMTGEERDLDVLKEKYEQEKALLEKYGEDTVNLTKRYEQEKARIKAGDIEGKFKGKSDYYELRKLQIENEVQAEEEKNIRLAKLNEERLQDEKRMYDELLALDDLDLQKRETYVTARELLEERIREAQRKTQEEEEKARQKAEEEAKKIKEAYLELADALTSVLGSVADMWQDAIERRVEEGKISEEEGEKEFERVKALQIASATINTIAGAIAAFMKAQETYPQPYGLIVGAASAAAVTASGIAQIAKIKSTSIGGGGSLSEGGSSSGVATPTQQAVQYAPQYSTQVTGQSDTVNLANAVGAAQGDQRVYVVESDIAQAGKKVEVRESESTF